MAIRSETVTTIICDGRVRPCGASVTFSLPQHSAARRAALQGWTADEAAICPACSTRGAVLPVPDQPLAPVTPLFPAPLRLTA